MSQFTPKQAITALRSKARTGDFWFNCLLYFCLSLALWPVTSWFAQSAHAQSRLLHALLILLAACALLVRFHGVKIENPLSLNKPARQYLWAAFGLLAISFLLRKFWHTESSGLQLLLSLIPIPAYCCALASVVLFILGPSAARIARTVSGSLCAFLLLSILKQPLDWPLRSIAGQCSGFILKVLGNSVELGLHQSTDLPPKLILLVNSHPFHVASECNGFGVILTSLLIVLILSIYRKLSPLKTICYLGLGLALGFTFNTVRIVCIVLLAPSLMEHYHLMHEIIGTLTYWGCLVLVWLILKGPTSEVSVKKPAAVN